MTKLYDCDICYDELWVCEKHPDKPFAHPFGCECSPGMPCKCNTDNPPKVNWKEIICERDDE